MSFRRKVILALILALAGCRGWKSVLVESEDFEPTLNVLAVLSPDLGGFVEVQVQRILPLEGSARTGEYVIDTVWVNDTTHYTQFVYTTFYEVTDAQVTLTDDSTTYPFKYVGKRKSPFQMGENSNVYYEGYSTAHYQPEDTTFVPRPGVTYHLRVETPDGLVVTGSATIPPAVSILADQVPDTLSFIDHVPLTWRASSGYYAVAHSIIEGEFYCASSDRAKVVGDTTWLLEPVRCGQSGPGEFKWAQIRLSVTAVDENYYRYFLQDPYRRQADDITVLLLGPGTTGKACGIEGGMGVFGSFRYDAIERLVLP